ncbi:hypothetical protein [Sphingobacterium sp. BS-2]|uniref:hypothetical protein n=1 Tax=Sphingobacterium sp. BS-2 TaxID=3377129 RepID=UPI0038FC3826
MASTVTIALTLEYNHIFDDTPNHVTDYLHGLNKSDLIKSFVFLITKQREGLHFGEILQMFFSDGNLEFSKHIYTKFRELNKQYQFIRILSALTLYRLCELSIELDGEEKEVSKEEFERNVFLAILVQNQENSILETKAGKFKEEYKDIELAAMLFSQSFPYFELVNFSLKNVVSTQIIRSIYLLEFLANGDEICRNLLRDFCSNYGFDDWRDYIKGHLALIIPIISKSQKAHTELFIEQNDNYEANCNFLDKLTIRDLESVSDYDFIKLRAAPLYKFEMGHYLIISDLFVAETLFKGVFFKLSEINSKNAIVGKPNLPNFRSFYCDNFSERHLLYSILDDIYSSYISLSGSQIKNISGIDAEPDYYVRNGKYLYLFESKDILINKTIKGSYDFNSYEPELRKRLHKGVTQLAKNIVRSLSKDFKFDTNYKENRLIINPIIIVHDRCYDTTGLNKIINFWFHEELKKLKENGFMIENVRPITIINIDTIILLHTQLKGRRISLDDLIVRYHYKMTMKKKQYRNEEHLHQAYKDTMISFTHFAESFISPLKVHPKLTELKIELFPDNK